MNSGTDINRFTSSSQHQSERQTNTIKQSPWLNDSKVNKYVICNKVNYGRRLIHLCRVDYSTFPLDRSIFSKKGVWLVFINTMALGGVCSLTNYSVAYEETQSNQVSDFRDMCSLFPKAILFHFYFTEIPVLYANSSAASDLDLHYLPLSLFWDARLK